MLWLRESAAAGRHITGDISLLLGKKTLKVGPQRLPEKQPAIH